MTPAMRTPCTAGALNEVPLTFRPLCEGQRETVVNVVDTESHELVTSVLVSTQAYAHL